jgi:competence ComEA-like helix-hairpin-helix protein
MSSTPFRIWLFRKSEQSAVAATIFLCLATIGGWWFVQNARSGGPLDGEEATQREFSFQIDINTAEANELATLPGIGGVLAERIVEYRERRGRIASVEELLEIKGIGKKVLEKFRPFLLPLDFPTAGQRTETGERREIKRDR